MLARTAGDSRETDFFAASSIWVPEIYRIAVNFSKHVVRRSRMLTRRAVLEKCVALGSVTVASASLADLEF
jgi:hypothetical protein